MPGELFDGWRQQCLSESGIEALVRPVGKRRLLRRAGSARTSNVAFRGITPDLTTAIQAVVKSGVDAGRIGAVARRTNLLLGMLTRRLPVGDRYAPRGQRWGGACDGRAFVGFHNASIEAHRVDRDEAACLGKVRISRHFASGANGIRTRDLLRAKQALSQLSYGPGTERV